jgi:predicted ABC-type ATPase
MENKSTASRIWSCQLGDGLSHPSRLDVIRDAKELGYTVVLIYVTTINPKINIERVRIRAEHGGHTVPDEKVISRYHRSIGMLPEMISLADEVSVANTGVPKALLSKKTIGAASWYDTLTVRSAFLKYGYGLL